MMLQELLSIQAVDQHAHNVQRPEMAPPFEAAFSESADRAVWQKDTPHTLFYQRSLNQLATLFGCPARPEAIKTTRAQWSIEELTSRCFEASSLKTLVLDDGLYPEKIFPWDWHNQFVKTKRLIRIEALAQTLITQGLSFEHFEEAYRCALMTSPEEVVGFKCIAAYRGGLAVDKATQAQASACYTELKGQRLGRSPLYSYLIRTALGIASERELPVQFHTGFGDPDLDLERSNPLLLKPLIEEFKCPFVLLHAGYPYFRELGYLASVYANVWTDFGLSIPFLSVRGMRTCLAGLLELAPLNKVMYSSDASLIPELFYLGALNGRRVLADVLSDSVIDGDLTPTQASQAAHQILAGNAERLYRL